MKLLKILKNPKLLGARFMEKTARLWDDESYLKWMFYFQMGTHLNLKNPRNFCEKLQWLKLHNRKPEYTMMVDKYLVRQYIADKLGEEYLIPLIGVYNSPNEINFDALPEQFVLKCNHNSGRGMCICKDKSKLDIEDVKRKLQAGLNEDYYLRGREWPYKNVPRKIICEKYMVDESGYELKDYKFFCFNGEVKYLKIDFDRATDHHANYYNPQFELQPFGEADFLPNPEKILKCPSSLMQMIDKAQQLSKDIPFLRVDFYNINGKIYFGELTFSPASGFGEFEPKEWDEKLGNLINLPIGGGILVKINKPMADLADYKFYCFDGKPRIVMVSSGRFEGNLCFDYYDMDWNKLSLVWDAPNSDIQQAKPSHFEEMKEMASKLCKGISHVRIDLYNINNHPYFGEITFFDSSGFCHFEEEKWNHKLGAWITLPDTLNLTCKKM